MSKGLWAVLVCLILGLIIWASAKQTLWGVIVGLLVGIVIAYFMSKKKK